MNYYLIIIIIILSLINIKFFIKGFNKDYLDKESTLGIKGLFLLFIFFVLYHYIKTSITMYELTSMVFGIMMLIITMKVKISNIILNWLGKNLFWIYILQRLPMLVLMNYKINLHPYRFAVISFILMIVIAVIVKYIVEFIEKIILKAGKKGAL